MVRAAYAHSSSKGFHEWPFNVAEKLMLMVSELAEAMEEDRNGRPRGEVRYVNGKPEGFGVELADCVIRIGDLCGRLGIDLEGLIEVKMKYNSTRPRKHGKAY
jgi:NTP pyrophosphatase (non-canonical NTP hydrolase)